MNKKITLALMLFSFFIVGNSYSQVVTKKAPAHLSADKSMLAPVEPTALTVDDVNFLPLDAVVIWGGPGDPDGEFADSLNNWTTTGTGEDGSDALWAWEADADASEGAYWGGATAIGSPSAANGAAVFNSDFLDNNGMAGNFGNGPSPSPHTSDLISPTIDLTNHTNVALNFYSYYRNFQSTPTVAYSNDNGMTWSEDIVIHPPVRVPTNVSTTNPDEVLLYLPGAGGTAEFKFRFRFTGEYYFWIIDDVALVEAPMNDLAIESIFYTPLCYGQPQGHIDTDTFFFSMNIANRGMVAQPNVELAARIFDPSNNLVFEDVLMVSEIATGIADSTYVLDNTFAPEGLATGRYRMEYSVSSDSTEQWQEDNTYVTFFGVTDGVFQRESGQGGNLRRGTTVGGLPDWELGSEYTTGADFMGEKYVARSITFAPWAQATNPLAGKQVSVVLCEFLPDFDPGEDLDYITDQNLPIRGFQLHTFTNEVSGDVITVELDNFDDENEPIFLTERTSYMALIDYPEALGNFFGREIDYGDRQYFWGYNGSWFGGFSNSTLSPEIRLNIGLTNHADERPLPESAMSVYPNPVQGQLTANIDLDVPSRATITISDVTGLIVSMNQYDRLSQDALTFNTSNYANGFYFIRLVTPKGTRTIKFVVQN